ncbi:MAG TPA: TIGR03013 family XrtA/PEP-CTERM system glycosyltransferase [Terriglobales bacterium]|jgi:sugar transferase (PEP-CTERM system associated)|nr:TIGR03013 family XrtA/PEP-CTERM system glycosyltransferase [Terriglobales bacterium]
MANEQSIYGESAGGVNVLPASRNAGNFRLINRSYGNIMVRIGGHYFPKKTLLLVISEGVLIFCSLLVATGLRFMKAAVIQDYLSDPRNWLRFLLVATICQLTLYYNDLYDLGTIRNRDALLVRSLRAVGIMLLVLSVTYYLVPPARLERGIVGLMSPLTIVLIVGWRLGFEASKGFTGAFERVLILGTGAQGIGLTREILRRPELQYQVVGFLDEKGENIGKSLVNPGIIGGVSQLEEVIETQHVDRVVISLGERRGVMPIRQLAALKLQGLPIEEAASVYERITGRIMLEQLRPSWLILSEGFRKSRFLLATKRMTDIAVSLLLIALSLPLMLGTALAIWIESGSPVLFRQERVGRGGRTFQILKFRSMKQGSEKGAPQWTADRDPRITRVGNFIRKFRLDELPQLFNILRGQMSLVGPRPEVPYFCELLEREIPYFNQRHSVRPGLTGWAQVKYQYGASLEEAKVKFEFDLFYIKNLSVLLDLAIIFETAKVVLLGRGAK